MKNFLKLGAWNALCDVCGFKFKNYELRKRWDGVLVCKYDFEVRHPQEYIKVRGERSINGAGGNYVRPESADSFVSTVDGVYCTLTQTAGQADYGTADCAQAGNQTVY